MAALSLLIVYAAVAVMMRLPAPPVEDSYSVYLPIVRQSGTTITVNTVEDELNEDGDCSLREAIQAANLDRVVDACQAGTGVDLVRLPAGEYNLTLDSVPEDGNTSGDLDVWSPLSVEGTDRELTIVSGEYSDRVFEIHPGASAMIRRVTIQSGRTPAATRTIAVNGCGGGVLNSGQLTLQQTVVRWNRTADGSQNDQIYCGSAADGGGICNWAGARLHVSDTLLYENSTGAGGYGCLRRQGAGGNGGGILNSGEASIVASEIFDNAAGNGYFAGRGGSGGGIFNGGVMDVISTTVHGNRSGHGISGEAYGIYSWGAGDGAGIVNVGSSRMTIVASSVYSNVTGYDYGSKHEGGAGGGIKNYGTLTMTNSTVSGNQASVNGGGGIANGPDTWITSSTIASNTAATQGGGIWGNPNASNTVVAGNAAGVDGPDCSGTLNALGYILLGSDAGCTISGDTVGNLINQPAQLLPLGNWGGSTWTHDLAVTSPAIDAGNCMDPAGQVITSDQRGVARPQGASCDIGAVEH